MITIDVKVEDLDVLVLTNIGAYTQDVNKDCKTIRLGTSSPEVAASWQKQLRAAARNTLVQTN